MVYIKPAKKAKIQQKTEILLKDIADVYAEDEYLSKIESVKLYEIPQKDKNSNHLVSSLDIIEKISKQFPGIQISVIGESDTLIEYCAKKAKGDKAAEYLKVALISLIMFAGSSTAIMSFHSDAQIPTVFKNYHYIFFKEKVENPIIIDLPYSIGLAVGVIVFFNHFAGKKMTDDPTPIQVQMSVYESDIVDTVIEIINTENERKEKNGKN